MFLAFYKYFLSDRFSYYLMDFSSVFFPYTTIRPQQDLFMSDLNQVFTHKKILIAHAPTGLGKTGSALSIAIDHALAHKKRVLFLTNRHTQHQLALQTIKQIQEKSGVTITAVDLFGKRWMCSQNVQNLFGNDFNEYCKAVVEKGECEFYNTVYTKKEPTVEAKLVISSLKKQGALHMEEMKSVCEEKRMCSYEISLSVAKDALVLVGDYNYLFSPFVQSSFFSKIGVEVEDFIVVVDEAHNLPSRVMEMMSSTLTTFSLKNSIIEAKKFGYGGIISWLQEIMRILTNFSSDFSANIQEKTINKNSFMKQISSFTDYDDLCNELAIAADEIRAKQRRSYLGGIAHFLESWKGEDEGFARILSEEKTPYGPSLTLHYSCLDPSVITKPVFSRVYAGVLMSGTFKPTSMYKDLLGIDRAQEKEYESPFPLENRLTLIVPQTTTKYSLRGETMFANIALICSKIIFLVPGNVALFFPSYDLRDRICLHLQSSKKFFWEKQDMTSEDKTLLLQDFKSCRKDGAVLLGVSGANFAEGVDLPGDLLNGVVVVGLPLGRPDLKTNRLIEYYTKRFGRGFEYGYIYPALNKCFQSAGRCIRSETDRGAVIFLDERFSWPNYFSCFPKEGVVVSSDYEKHLQNFFK